MLCHDFTRHIQNAKKAHCLFQRKVTIWSCGRGTVTGVQYGWMDGWMEGAGRSTEKGRRDLSRIGAPAGHSPAGKETYRVYRYLVFLKQFI